MPTDELMNPLAPDARQIAQVYSFKSLGDIWVGFYTNAYKDRDGEYFPEDEIARDIERMNTEGDYPPLLYGHVPWAVIGQAQSAIKVGRFGVTLGTWADHPLAQAVKQACEQDPQNYGMSFGFEFSPEKMQHNAFYEFKTFEVSVLPIQDAANSFTQFIAQTKGHSMNPNGNAEKMVRAFLTKVGVDDPDAIIASLMESGSKATLLADSATQRDYKADDLAAMIEEEGAEDVAEIELEAPIKAYVDKAFNELERKMADMVKSMLSDYEQKMSDMMKPKSEMEELGNAIKQLQTQQASQSMQGSRAAALLQEQRDNASQVDKYKAAREQGHDVGFFEFLTGAK